MVKQISPTTGESSQTTTILSAALDVLRTDGPGGLTVRKVAATAGCSTTGVYTWFGGKTGLLDAIVIAGFQSFDDALAEVEPATHNVFDVDWLVARGVAYRQWALQHPTEYLVMFTRLPVADGLSSQATERGLESYDSHIQSVRQVQAGGSLTSADAEPVAHHMWATAHGYVMLELCGPGPDASRPNTGGPDGYEDGYPDRYEAGLRALMQGFNS